MALTLSCDGLDLSLLNPTQFKLVFSKIPNTEFFCQSISIPALRLNPVTQNTPFLDVNWQGEKVNHEPLVASILLDKQMNTYSEIYKWLKGMSVLKQAEEGFSDCQVIIGEKTFNFVDVWPMSLAAIDLSIATPVVETVAFTVMFEYDYFDLV